MAPADKRPLSRVGADGCGISRLNLSPGRLIARTHEKIPMLGSTGILFANNATSLVVHENCEKKDDGKWNSDQPE
jgi:hypothetical protein